MINFQEELNEEQYEAVINNEGPLLVLAGAGTGKTRVITYKMAYLINELNVEPYSILSVTFTNKAADEMKERLALLVGDKSRSVWCGTFHSVALRMLRQNGKSVGLTKGFGIVDQDDRISILRSVLKDLNIDAKKYSPKLYLSLISDFKNTIEFVDGNYPLSDESVLKIDDVFNEYQRRLKDSNAIDFDDMLSLVIRMFRENTEINDYYKNSFRHILVDEYQDTNFIQFVFLKLLAGDDGNICVVGDDDQSIYGWRGAEIKNILDFDGFYKNVKTVTLIKNYRSTPKILFAANTLISHNRFRKKKSLQPVTDEPGIVEVNKFQSGQDEAFAVSSQIKDFINEGENPNEIAILYRTNAQSRNFEIELNKYGINYKVVGGIGFYQRKEIKDILAYLKFYDNKFDKQSFARSIKVPSRKIGDATIGKIVEYAAYKGMDLLAALSEYSVKLKKNKEKIDEYLNIFTSVSESGSIAEMIEKIIQNSDYFEYLKKNETKQDAENRMANLEELINAAAEFEEKNTDATLSDFLSTTTLYTASDEISNEAVKLMTIHAAKGLEFKTVFLTGLEDGLFPLFRVYEDSSGMEFEEERRLCYVGITRAKRNLFLSYASSRMTYGKWMSCKKSPFLHDLGIENNFDSFNVKIRKEVDTGCGNDSIKDGDRVFHEKFGEGMVVGITGSGDDAKISVFFKKGGLKKIVARFLQKI